MEARGQWESRSSFVLAAIGSAIGLGNIWRFPYICANNGGGAFLVAFLIALMTAGLPILIMELSMGHKTQRAASGAFASVKGKYELFGWIAIGIAFVITTYYAAIMSWSFKYLWDAFSLGWGSNTSDFFFKETLGLTKGAFEFGGIKLPLFIGLILTWISIVACIWKGPETVGKIVYLTVLVPWVILVVLVVRGVTLEGADVGLAYYLTPDFTKLLSGKVWLAAYTQVFFSLSIGFSIMFAYGSYLPKKTHIVTNAYIVAIGDSLTAFLGGLAVFGALGYLSVSTNTPINELKASGPGLAFVVYPTIINKLPMLNNLFGVLFFVMLLTLGIDSAFSLVEGVTSGLRDKLGWTHKRANITVALVAFMFGLIFISGAGLYWLDIVDYFLNFFGLALVCIIECYVFGWVFGTKKIIDHNNEMPGLKLGKVWEVMIKYVAPVILVVLLISEAITRFKSPYGGYSRSAEFIGFLVMFVFIPLGAFILSKIKSKDNEKIK
ncbi:MAG: sodium-dependent transporter [Desulfobacterales bacterium]|nr:sodium-dependent transporter [Desulfobacterales bacterium]